MPGRQYEQGRDGPSPTPAQRAAGGGLLDVFGAAGNMAVQRMISVQRDDFQLTLPPIGEGIGWRPPPNDDHKLKLDPQIEAYFRATQALHAHVAPPAVAGGLARIDITIPPMPVPPPGPQPLPPGPPPAPAPAPAPEPRPDPAGRQPQPRKADFGDVWKQVQAQPQIGPALDKLQNDALLKLRSEWTSLSGGEKVVVVATGITLAGSTLAGVLSSDEARIWARDQVNGKKFPVPGVDGLHVELTFTDTAIGLGLHLDVGRFLPPSLGFGPGGPGTLGGPPTPPSGPGPF